MRGRRQWVLSALVAVVLCACNVVASQSLLATLPTSAAGVRFDTSRVIEESALLWGHPVDDVLRALGKGRSDATTVERYAQVGEGGIGAVRVPGVTGEELLETVVAHWSAPSVVARTETEIGGKQVWVVEHRGAAPDDLFYRVGDIVYWAAAVDRQLAEQFIAAMP